jgi:hypothetical protein
MTAARHHRRRALLFAAGLLAAFLPVLSPQSALADDPPPITVPTPTVPAPTPDTAPKPAPPPARRYRPPATRSYTPPSQYTPAPSRPAFSQPLSTAIRKALTGRPKRTARPKKHRVAPIVPVRAKSAPTYARDRFRPAASDRAPVPVHQPVARKTHQQDGGLSWVLPLAIVIAVALAIATALAIAVRSKRVRPHLPRLTSYGASALVFLGALRERVEFARQRFAKFRPQLGAVDTRRWIPHGKWDGVELRLRRENFDSLRRRAAGLRPQLNVYAGRLSPHVARGAIQHHQVTGAQPVPEPVVARLEAVAVADALFEPELAAAILSPAPSPRVDERTTVPALSERPLMDVSPLPQPAPPAAPPTEELCEIAVWRGYTKSRFYARLDVAACFDQEGCAVGESTPFRFSGNGTLEQTEAAEAAHRALIEELVAQGWEPLDSRGPWYAARFSRALTA